MNTAMKMLRVASTMLATGLLTISVTAEAQIADDQRQAVSVSYHAADLQTEAGKASFARKLRLAAQRVCGAPASHSIADNQWVMECRTAAIARAQDEVVRRQVAQQATTRWAIQSGG